MCGRERYQDFSPLRHEQLNCTSATIAAGIAGAEKRPQRAGGLRIANQAEMVGATFGRGVAAIISTAFGFIWPGWGFSVLQGLPVVICVGYFLVSAALMAFAGPI